MPELLSGGADEVVSVEHLRVRYGDTLAVDDVSLSINRGEIFGILGPNGAGKTTLLKILAGLVLPTSGRALVGGVDVARDDRRVKRSIGFVTSDERSFYWRLTGRENLDFFARLYDLPATEHMAKVE